MGEPFTGAPDEKSRRLRQSEADIKLAAAKEVIVEELHELGDSVQVVVFGFTSRTELIFEGRAGLRNEIRAKFDAVHASNGTDIAAALNAAADYREMQRGDGVPRIVLISDGKSDKAEAMRAARRCADLSMGIHFILIDPTEEGEAFRREVVRSVGGTSESVTSRSQLKKTTRQARAAYHEDQARAEQFLKTAETEAETIRKETEDRHRIEFTSGYPGRIHPDKAYPLIVYVHLAAMRREVEKRLASTSSIFGELPRKSEAETNQLFPVGTNLEITPRINNLAVNPTQQSLTWLGEIEEVSFRVRYAGPDDLAMACSGFIDVTTSGLLIGQIPVSVSVGADKKASSWEQRKAEMISRVFASYAREDSPIVEACKAAYRALGIHLFVDKDDLLSGQSWREVIRRSISNHDLFQLFWSKHAADSSEVANEWHLALEITPQRNCDFLRPVYWSKPMVDPPGELKHLNFGFLDLNSVKVKPEHAAEAATPLEHNSRRIETKFPLLEVVECKASAVEIFREDLSTVVPFLEHTIGTRYYPPVTFLVDENSVRMLRATAMPCEQPNSDLDPGEEVTRHVTALLQSLALGFHVGNLIGSTKAGFGERHVFFEALDPTGKADFDHVQRMNEYLFSGPSRKFLAGENVLGAGRATMEDVLRDVSNKKGQGWKAERMIKTLLEVTSPADRSEVERAVSKDDLKQLGSFNEDESSTAARKVFSSELPRLAAKYRVELFFGQPDMTELRLKRTFVEYIRGFCDRWLSFVDVALRKRGNVIVDVGYSAPEAALQWLESAARGVRIHRKAQTTGWASNEQGRYYEIHLQDYRFCVEMLSKRLLERLAQGSKQIGQILLPAIASTYGVFLMGTAASAQVQFQATLTRSNWPKQAALSGQDKVLVCLGAIDRLRQKMQQESLGETKALELSRRFALAVLVHEHFHSALATGIDRNGHTPLGPQRLDEWETATKLNESLAAWVERHFFRQDPEMVDHIDAYIRSGEYPSWPYRGAETIERLYQQGGLPTVRGWIQYLRDDPVNAQKEFDERVTSTSI